MLFINVKSIENSSLATKMASSSFSDAPNPDVVDSESKSVTIVINDNGEINYDEKTLQSIIGKFFDREKYPNSNFIFM